MTSAFSRIRSKLFGLVKIQAVGKTAPCKSPNACSSVMCEHLLVGIQLNCSHLGRNCHLSCQLTLAYAPNSMRQSQKGCACCASHDVKTLCFLFYSVLCIIVYMGCVREITHMPRKECRGQRTFFFFFGVRSLFSALRGFQKLNSCHRAFEASAFTH